MRRSGLLVALLGLAAAAASPSLHAGPGEAPGRRDTLSIASLKAPVEVIRDRWGLNHIYAQNEDDLFLAQGYLAAKKANAVFRGSSRRSPPRTASTTSRPW